MKNFRKSWEITKNWQLLFPTLGILTSLLCGYLIGKRVITSLPIGSDLGKCISLCALTLALGYLCIRVSLWLFKKLEKKWIVTYRWEFIAIFLCFAITGSTAGRLSDPLMQIIGLSKEVISGWIYWPVRILLIFPIYQVLLVIFGWCFGQYRFFMQFAKKMMSRIGFGFLIKNL